jgi:hypothetical protein
LSYLACGRSTSRLRTYYTAPHHRHGFAILDHPTASAVATGTIGHHHASGTTTVGTPAHPHCRSTAGLNDYLELMLPPASAPYDKDADSTTRATKYRESRNYEANVEFHDWTIAHPG